jgi:hypothetical protein
MINLIVTHPDSPGGAAGVAIDCLKKANIAAVQVDDDIISITDSTVADDAIGALKKSGFRVGHPDTSSRYS